MKLFCKYFLIFSFAIGLNSCLDDNITEEEFDYFESADLITYFETNSNFIETEEYLFLIGADEVYEHLDDYLLLDIRSKEQFDKGHIQNAINIQLDGLISLLNSKDSQSVDKNIIISESGQKAAYTVAILRLYGFRNTFSMDYGMGQWNKAFSDIWINARGDSKYKGQLHLDNNIYPKLNKNLPSISLVFENNSFISAVEKRIEAFLTEEQFHSTISTIDEMEERYHMLNRVFENSYIICNGDLRLYNIKQIIKDVSPGPIIYGGHPRTSILYSSLSDFRSTNLLLTLPPEETIFVYSFNGQRSSYLVAYLRILGYDARSVLYGGVSMFYNHMDYQRIEESFLVKNIREYPYVQ